MQAYNFFIVTQETCRVNKKGEAFAPLLLI